MLSGDRRKLLYFSQIVFRFTYFILFFPHSHWRRRRYVETVLFLVRKIECIIVRLRLVFRTRFRTDSVDNLMLRDEP
jgi:hypothetical protein